MLRFLPLLFLPVMAFAAENRSSDSKTELRRNPTAEAAIEPPVQAPTGAPPAAAPDKRRVKASPRGSKSKAEGATPIIHSDPNARDVIEFSGDPIDVVLRTLARKARMDLVVSPAVCKSEGVTRAVRTPLTGDSPAGMLGVIFLVNDFLNFISTPGSSETTRTVNLRLEGKSAREVIDVICQTNDLVVTQKNGVYYIKTKFEDAEKEVKELARRRKLQFDASVAAGFTRAEAMQFLLQGKEAPANAAKAQ